MSYAFAEMLLIRNPLKMNGHRQLPARESKHVKMVDLQIYPTRTTVYPGGDLVTVNCPSTKLTVKRSINATLVFVGKIGMLLYSGKTVRHITSMGDGAYGI